MLCQTVCRKGLYFAYNISLVMKRCDPKDGFNRSSTLLTLISSGAFFCPVWRGCHSPYQTFQHSHWAAFMGRRKPATNAKLLAFHHIRGRLPVPAAVATICLVIRGLWHYHPWPDAFCMPAGCDRSAQHQPSVLHCNSDNRCRKI